MRIAARYADEWNAWTTPDVLAHKVGVLRTALRGPGARPSEIKVSTQALLFLVDRRDLAVGEARPDVGRAAVVGNPAEVTEIVGTLRRGRRRRVHHPGLHAGSDAAS